MKYLKLIIVLMLLSGCVIENRSERSYKVLDVKERNWITCDYETGIEYFASRYDGSLFVRLDANGLPKRCEKK